MGLGSRHFSVCAVISQVHSPVLAALTRSSEVRLHVLWKARTAAAAAMQLAIETT